MKIKKFENGPFAVNTFLITNKKNNEGIVLDPGSDTSELINFINKEKVKIKAIIATHGHIDHVAGVDKIKKEYNVPFYLNELDNQLLEMIPAQAKMFGIKSSGVPTVDKKLPLSGEIEIAGFKIKLLHTPGHSAGSVSLLFGNVVFVGDALFNMSIGRTDLPGGNHSTLISSIKKKLFTLPENTVVYCGHGPETKIGTEKSSNPFF